MAPQGRLGGGEGTTPEGRLPTSLEGGRWEAGEVQPAESMDYGLDVQPESGINWGRYLSACRRYKWLIVATTLLGTVLGVAASRFVKPQYTAAATIWIQPETPTAGPIRAEGLLKSYAWLELLNTGVVLDSVSLKLRLYLTPASKGDSVLFRNFELGDRYPTGTFTLNVNNGRYDLVNQDGTVLDRGELGSAIGESVGFRWHPDPALLQGRRSVGFTLVTPFDASNQIRRSMRPNMVPDGKFLRISMDGTDPDLLAKTLNAITHQFISVAAEQKRLKLAVQVKELQDQVASAAEKLRLAEDALESFRVRTISLPNEAAPVAAGLQQTQPVVTSRFFQQRITLDSLRSDREKLEALLPAFVNGSANGDALRTVPAVTSSQDLSAALSELSEQQVALRSMRQTFTDEYPPLKTAIDRVHDLRAVVIPHYVQSLLDQLKSQEQHLEGQITAGREELQQIPVRTITEQRLTREKASAERLFQMLSDNYTEARFALASALPDVQLLDAAVPPSRPSTNTAPMLILLSCMGSLAAAVGLAILLDRLDKRFRYLEQVTTELGLSVLGAIPAIKRAKNGGAHPETASQVVEAFRTVRLNLVHSYGAAGPVVLTVSSPSPGDGKSLVSSNLALSFSEAGYNTLLIDGDIRRGEAHRMFDTTRKPGLLDIIVGDATVEQGIRRTRNARLTLLPCGTRRHMGPELLSSAAMRDLMASMKSQFDVIIVDSPPMGAGIDPFVLATLTGHILLVLRSGETDRNLTQAKLQLFDRLPVRILGAVLNDISTREASYRYYSYVYNYVPDDEAYLELPRGVGEARERES